GWKVVAMARGFLSPLSLTDSPAAPQGGCVAVELARAGKRALMSSGHMRGDRSSTERILNVLRPYASNWTGSLGRGDLVIPQRETPRVIHEILAALTDEAAQKEAGDRGLFDVLMTARRSASVQDQADLLRKHFRILLR